MLVEFISGIGTLILSPSPNPTSSRLSTGVGSFSYFCVSFCFHILQWIFSHQVMLHLLDWNSMLCSATICLPASVPFAYCIYHLQCNVVIISIFQLHSIKQPWMYIMPWSMKLYLGHTWFHWPTCQYVFPNYLWEKDLTLLWSVQFLTIIGKGR
jgi:hypothetical protein